MTINRLLLMSRFGQACTLLIAGLLLSAAPLLSQTDEEDPEVEDDGRIDAPSTPIEPNLGRVWPEDIGLLLGVGFNQQSGVFTSSCECPFTEGAESGFLIGAFYQKDFARTFSWGVRLTYEQRNLTAKFLEYETLQLSDPRTQQVFETDVRFRHEANADFNIFAITPYLQWAPAKFVYFQFGLSPHFLSGASIKHVKEIAQRTVRGPGGQILVPRIGDPPSSSALIDEGDFPELNSFQFAATGSVGFQISLGGDMALLPMFQYVLPFTTLSENGEDFKISSGQLLLGITKQL